MKVRVPAASPEVTSSMESVRVPSSSVIVPVPWASAIVTLTPLVRLTVKVSFNSSTISPITTTDIVCVVVPGAKVRVPEVAV